MNTKKYLLLFTLIFCSATFVSAQSEESDAPFVFNQAGRKPFDIGFFLPVKPASWTISLTASGGFAGGTRFLIALNSNGVVMCSPDEKTFQNRFAPKEDFEKIAQLVRGELTFPSVKSGKSNAKLAAYCSDCSVQTVSIDFRGRKSILTKNFAVENFDSSQTQNKEIYQAMSALNVCGQ